ncbi:MAG: COG3014 family protein [Dissulfuribacterales bacterium]
MTEAAHVARKLSSWCLLFCLIAGVMSGCASAKLKQARRDFYNGYPDQATEVLSDTEDISSRDRLLFYMEKGLILHHSGNYRESIDTFLSASALMKDQEVISAGEQTGSLVTSERIVSYKGEYAERLLIHTYLIMNYLMINDHDDALVEAKQALEVYETYPDACRDDYFTRALIAHCYEAVGDINDAYIEYKKLAELMSDPTPVADKLCALGARLGFDDEVAIYSQYLPETERQPAGAESPAELIVFISQGRSPVKIPKNIVLPPSIRFSFSTYKSRSGSFFPPTVRASKTSGPVDMITTDVGAVLKASLKERLAQIMVKETARVAAKEAIAHNIDDPLVETLARVVFLIMEEPDTRSWQTLPAYLAMVRIPLQPGLHSIMISDATGGGGTISVPEFETTPGRQYYYYSVRNNSRLKNF